jgi:hypothetical protein
MVKRTGWLNCWWRASERQLPRFSHCQVPTSRLESAYAFTVHYIEEYLCENILHHLSSHTRPPSQYVVTHTQTTPSPITRRDDEELDIDIISAQMNAFNTLLARQTTSRFASLSSASKLSRVHLRSVHIEKRIEELKIELPPAPLPKANYNIVCKSDGIIYVSGHLPIKVRLFCWCASYDSSQLL